MRWAPGHQSRDLIDRRGRRNTGVGGAMAILPLLLRLRYGWLIVLALVGLSIFGGAFRRAVDDTGSPVAGQQARSADTRAQFVAFVLDDVQSTWDQKLSGSATPYRHAKLVLFTDITQTGCGFGQAATGPFYCPNDERVYIDLGFYEQLAQRFGARGDFAQAYVIAHEIGHHVQNVLGISERVRDATRAALQGAEGFSVRMELQADCFAGVWANTTERRDLLEAGDIDEALNAAAAIGDDRLQRRRAGTVNPEAWTHGSSEQRSRWFRRGYDRGDRTACDTFSTDPL